VQRLGIAGSQENLCLKTITGTTNYKSISFDFEVSDLNNEVSFFLPKVHSIERIPVQHNNVLVNSELRNLPYLQNIPIKCLPHSSVELLIGADVPEIFCIYSAKRGPQGTPCAIETPLGWSLLGPSLSPSKLSNCTANFVDKGKLPIEAMVENMWASEFDPGTSILDVPTSGEDRAAYDTLKSSVQSNLDLTD